MSDTKEANKEEKLEDKNEVKEPAEADQATGSQEAPETTYKDRTEMTKSIINMLRGIDEQKEESYPNACTHDNMESSASPKNSPKNSPKMENDDYDSSSPLSPWAPQPTPKNVLLYELKTKKKKNMRRRKRANASHSKQSTSTDENAEPKKKK